MARIALAYTVLVLVLLTGLPAHPVYGSAVAENSPAATIRYGADTVVVAGYAAGRYAVVVLRDGLVEYRGLNGSLETAIDLAASFDGDNTTIHARGAQMCSGGYLAVWGRLNDTRGFIAVLDIGGRRVAARHVVDREPSTVGFDYGCSRAAYAAGRDIVYLAISTPTQQILPLWRKTVSTSPRRLLLVDGLLAAVWDDVVERKTTVTYYNGSGNPVYTVSLSGLLVDADNGDGVAAILTHDNLHMLDTHSGVNTTINTSLATHVRVSGGLVFVATGSAVNVYAGNGTLLGSYDVEEVAGRYGSGITCMGVSVENDTAHVAAATANKHIVMIRFMGGGAGAEWYWSNPAMEEAEHIHVSGDGNLTVVTWWESEITLLNIRYRVSLLTQPQPGAGNETSGAEESPADSGSTGQGGNTTTGATETSTANEAAGSGEEPGAAETMGGWEWGTVALVAAAAVLVAAIVLYLVMRGSRGRNVIL